MQHFEIGLNSGKLSWRKHVFSDLVHRMEPASTLVWEPIFDNSGDILFTIEPETQITWKWDNIEYAQIITWRKKDPILSNQTLRYPEQPCVQFEHLADVTILEINLYTTGGQINTIKYNLPERFLVSFERKLNSIFINVNKTASTENLIVERYQLHGEYGYLSRGASNFGPPVPIPNRHNFFNYLVVIKQKGHQRKMLGYAPIGYEAGVIDLLQTGENEYEREQLRRFIEGISNHKPDPKSLDWAEWLDNWSYISQQKLLKIVDLACLHLRLSKSDAQKSAQNHLTGLHRALVLNMLGCPWVKTGKWKIESLDLADDFLQSVGRLKKNFDKILSTLTAPDEKVWAIINAEKDCLDQAVTKAGGKGLPLMQREMHLLEMRDRAVQSRYAKG